MTKGSDTKIIDSGVIHLGLSDHSLAYICRKVGIPRAEPKMVETRQFKYFDSAAFQHDLKMAFQMHYNLYNYTDPNRAWEELFFLMLQIYMLHFGFVKSKVNSVLG